ncbi:MAG: dihydrodipicolinate synthase family protein [Myxococcota bacterium]|nr:dihydrodipicolinate synthase family protein [Myxococcota bacterium]
MGSVEAARPCPGLSVPVATVLDSAGGFLEADQRALVRFVIQEGWGADVVFAAGTTGEWDRLPAATCQRVIQVCAEEVAKANAGRRPGDGRPVEAWAGITAHTPADTLENLERAIEHGADALVLAPLSIRGVEDPVRFVTHDVADSMDRCARRVPLYLYDNADIAVDPAVPHIRTHQVKALSRLDFVRGIKVSARRKVLGDYMRAAATFRDRGEFGIYVGNAMLIFHIFRPRSRWFGALSRRYQRGRLRGGLPIGVVAGPANVLPREWARAWQVSRAGDAERMDACRRLFEAYREATQAAAGPRGIACMKRALVQCGVVSSDAVAPGTPRLAPDEAAAFDAAFQQVRELARDLVGAPWLSEWHGHEGGAG